MVRQPTDLLEPPAEVTAQLLFPSGALVRWSDRSPIESGFLVERRAAHSDTYVTVGNVLLDTVGIGLLATVTVCGRCGLLLLPIHARAGSKFR